ncbi:MAG TPA: hypothetical protein VK553_09340, partial [Candidatus Nitrosopolaris rasttigaisensis]|nr:hypothetical protein [Candidatus Nitrosopolaris rasttigaisensis]
MLTHDIFSLFSQGRFTLDFFATSITWGDCINKLTQLLYLNPKSSARHFAYTLVNVSYPTLGDLSRASTTRLVGSFMVFPP